MVKPELATLLAEVRACTLCRGLPLGPKPILQAAAGARILLAGQAPGAVTHQRGRPFDDLSGDRLRQWLAVDRDTFYDPHKFAILPMGFCYPGTVIRQGRRQGDLPPRAECAATWRRALLNALPDISFTLLLGRYALDWHLPGNHGLSMAVANWQDYWPSVAVLPHPSPRNTAWLKRHPGFEQELLPRIRERVHQLLQLPGKGPA